MKCLRLTLLLLIAAGWGPGCSSEDDFSRPDPPLSAESVLRPPGGESASVIAWFGQVPVTQADLDVLEVAGSDKDTMVKMVALRRKLAALALGEGLGDRPSVRMAWYQGLARRWLEQKFEVEHTPESVSMERWKKLYNDTRVRPMFDHRDTYFIRDAQIICCSEGGGSCRRSSRYEACLRDVAPKIQEAYAQLQLLGPATAEEFQKAVAKVGPQIEGLGYQNYEFQYDFSKSFERQQGYAVVDENIARAARETPVGTISAPVRSAYGWHILFVEKYIPDLKMPFGDPEVMETLMREGHGLMRDEDAALFIGELIKRFEISVDADQLRSADWGKISGLNL